MVTAPTTLPPSFNGAAASAVHLAAARNQAKIIAPGEQILHIGVLDQFAVAVIAVGIFQQRGGAVEVPPVGGQKRGAAAREAFAVGEQVFLIVNGVRGAQRKFIHPCAAGQFGVAIDSQRAQFGLKLLERLARIPRADVRGVGDDARNRLDFFVENFLAFRLGDLVHISVHAEAEHHGGQRADGSNDEENLTGQGLTGERPGHVVFSGSCFWVDATIRALFARQV